MKAIKISYSRGYSIAPYLQEKPGIEAELEEGEDPIEALSKLKALTDKFHRETNPGLYVENMETGEITIGNRVNDTPPDADQSLIETLNYCTSKQLLEKFRPQVERRNNPKVTEAFKNKLKSFE